MSKNHSQTSVPAPTLPVSETVHSLTARPRLRKYDVVILAVVVVAVVVDVVKLRPIYVRLTLPGVLVRPTVRT